MSIFLRKYFIALGYFTATLIIFAALIVSLSGLLTPFLTEHRNQFAKWAGDFLKVPLAIQEVHIAWHFLEPELVFDKVDLLDEKTHQPRLTFKKIKININIFQSLFQRKFSLDTIEVGGTHLSITQTAKKEFNVVGFGKVNLPEEGEISSSSSITDWVLHLRGLTLDDIHIDYLPLQGESHSFIIHYATLSSSKDSHALSAEIMLDQMLPTAFLIKLNWKGDSLDLSQMKAHLYLGIDHLSLPQWLSHQSLFMLQPVQGLGTAHIVADWEEGDWKTIEGDIGVYGLALHPASSKDKQQKAIFDNALTLDRVKVEFTSRKNEDGLIQLDAKTIEIKNEDMSAHGSMTLILPPDDSPHVNLSFDFSMSNAGHISTYLPLAIFNSELKTWLRHAFKNGSIENGKAILQGRLKDFPFDAGAGRFEIGGEVHDLTFHYAPDWPVIRKVNGKLLFSGRSMTAEVDSGEMLNVPLHDIHAVIPYLGDDRPQILNVQGVIASNLSDGMHFIEESPLQKTVGKNLSGIQLKGPMQLKLGLSVPIAKPSKTSVVGDLLISNTLLSIPDWNMDFHNVEGIIHFTEDDIVAKKIHATLWGEKAELSLITEHPERLESFVNISLKGILSANALQSWLKIPLSEYVQGKAPYQAELHLYSYEKQNPSELHLQTNLKGIAVTLPDQYGKKADEERPMEFFAYFKENQPIKIKWVYDKLATAALTIVKTTKGLQLNSGELNLGGTATWQQTPGLLVSFSVNELDWNTWRKYLNQSNSSFKLPSDILFRGFNVNAKRINGLGLALSNVNIMLSELKNNWQVKIASNEVQGDISLPADFKNGTIKATFSRFYINPVAASSSLDTVSRPSLSFRANDVRYKGKVIGNVTIETVSTQKRMQIKSFYIQSPLFQFDARGQWEGSVSGIQGSLKTKHISGLLIQWGLNSSNLVDSGGVVDFKLNWKGAPYNPSFRNMTGTVSINLNEGRIVNLGDSTDAKMGIGRLLNLFSLQTIPRRLSLDFSDIFESGYSFDSMKGDFTLKNGSAYTRNMRFDGPIARVDIIGRIGFSAKDYDFLLSVTPYVTSSLPVVATLAGGPLVGAATWVVNAVVSHQVSKVATYQYEVTGSWDHPVWKQVSR